MRKSPPSNNRNVTLFALIAKEDDGLITVVGSSEEPSKRLLSLQRLAAKESTTQQGAIVSFIKYCSEQKLSWEYRELSVCNGTSHDMKYEVQNWNASAMCAGLNPKFYYREDKAQSVIARVAAGQLTLRISQWPTDLYPEKPFVNPFYAHYTLGGKVVTLPSISSEK